MIKTGITGIGFGSDGEPRRVFTAGVVFLLLTSQAGLAFHGASHLHCLDQAGECSLCLVGSNNIAEPVALMNLSVARPVRTLPAQKPSVPSGSHLPAPAVRGPPPASV